MVNKQLIAPATTIFPEFNKIEKKIEEQKTRQITFYLVIMILKIVSER